MASASLPRISGVRDAERSVARMFVAARSGQLLFSSLMVASDRRRFSRPRLQWLLLGAATVESAWLARRVLQEGRYAESSLLWIDAVAATLGLVTCQAGVGSADAGLWMKNLVVGAAQGASSSNNTLERAGAVGLLGAAILWCGVRAGGRDSHLAGWTLAVNDLISVTGQHVAARTYVSAHLRYAALAEDAALVTVARAGEAAAEAERIRQHRMLHAQTVRVLHALAEMVDEDEAGLLAQREAARLRHALRSRAPWPSSDGGRPDFDAALETVSQEATEAGLAVELVTSELTSEVEAGVAEVTIEAVRLALAAARELGGARRAVVRAADNDSGVTVTVRHQGDGFAPGTGSAYLVRLEALGPMLASVGAKAGVWSAPGRGVRVTLDVPGRAGPAGSAGEGQPDQLPHRLPDDGVGLAPAAQHDLARGDGHFGRRLVAVIVGRVQDQIRGQRIIEDIQAGRTGHALEPGAQEWRRRHDPDGRVSSHEARMTPAAGPVVVRSTPFGDEDDAGRAGRTVISGFLAYRFSGLATGLAALVAGRSHYRRPRLATVQVAAATAESIWLARRLWRRGGVDPTAAAVDAAFAVAAITAGRASIAPTDRWTYLNWAPWGIAAPGVAGQAMMAPEISVQAVFNAALMGTTASAVLSARRSQFATNMAAMAAFFVGGYLLARQIRLWSSRLDAARAEAAAEGAVLAAEQERSRQLRILHDSALQTLEAVGSRRFSGLDAVRARLRDEAARLQAELDGGRAPAGSLAEALERVVLVHETNGLVVDLVAGPAPEPSAQVIAALCDACHEALTNVAKHSGTTRATVRIESVWEGVSISISDEGTGFDPDGPRGFGTRESIQRRLADVGGRAEIVTAPGRGTRVHLWGRA